MNTDDYILRLDRNRPVEWGEPLGYVTDDRDLASDRQRIVWIQQGGNGDFYVSTTGIRERPMHGVRLCTSGGASSRMGGLVRGVADAYRAMVEQARADFARRTDGK